MTELLAIGMGVMSLTAIGLALYALYLRGQVGDLRFDLADRDRTIANASAEIMASQKAVAMRTTELARCREQKGDAHEALATAGTPGAAAAVDDVLGGLYQDPGDQDPGGHDGR